MLICRILVRKTFYSLTVAPCICSMQLCSPEENVIKLLQSSFHPSTYLISRNSMLSILRSYFHFFFFFFSFLIFNFLNWFINSFFFFFFQILELQPLEDKEIIKQMGSAINSYKIIDSFSVLYSTPTFPDGQWNALYILVINDNLWNPAVPSFDAPWQGCLKARKAGKYPLSHPR